MKTGVATPEVVDDARRAHADDALQVYLSRMADDHALPLALPKSCVHGWTFTLILNIPLTPSARTHVLQALLPFKTMGYSCIGNEGTALACHSNCPASLDVMQSMRWLPSGPAQLLSGGPSWTSSGQSQHDELRRRGSVWQPADST